MTIQGSIVQGKRRMRHEAPGYLDSERSIEDRVQDLIRRMTLAEKAAQMVCVWRQRQGTLYNERSEFDADLAREHYAHGLGQVARPSDSGQGCNARQNAELTNAIQRFFVEETRLGIPVMFHEECLHGLMAKESTNFPQPIALAGTFDPKLVQELYRVTAAEARARGTHHALTPVVDVARDPRWGRVEETFGEDPYLVAQMGIAAVRGLQGETPLADRESIIATLKHFAAHGEPEAGINCGPVNVSMRVLREVFLQPFRDVIRVAAPLAVMASYNEIDGVPSHANRWLLQDVLRKEWGFQGIVVSDYFALRELHDRPETHGHHVAEDARHAARLALEAGVNLELPDPDCYRHIVDLVQDGEMPIERIDTLVRAILACKFRLGLFERPYVEPEHAQRVVDRADHRDVAVRVARQAITLLKNDGPILPLDPSVKRTIAVIGPNADRELLGGYSGQPKHSSTVVQGLRNLLGDHIHVIYHQGCPITIGGSWWEDAVTASDPVLDRESIREAAAVAAEADIIILAVGGNEQTSREGWDLGHLGDRASLDLVGRQDELIEAIAATGKPIVALVFGGRPLALGHLCEHSAAVLQCWYLGQETGHAVAETLFGANNPSGKLAISFPRSVGHLPVFYNHKPSARRGYLFDEVTPLFPFGFGLSYTQFRFSAPRLEKLEIQSHESTRVFVDVTNAGDRRGAEVVQLYVRDCFSTVTRPIKELKGFERVELDPGETKTVKLDLTPDSLAFYDIDMNWTVEPGTFDILVGPSSCQLQSITLKVISDR